MRLTALFLLALTSCASAVAPASRPAGSLVYVPPGIVLDETGVRELLAGVELELGDRDAEVAAANQRTNIAEQKAVISGVAGAIIGALVAIVAGAIGGR